MKLLLLNRKTNYNVAYVTEHLTLLNEYNLSIDFGNNLLSLKYIIAIGKKITNFDLFFARQVIFGRVV